MTSERPGPRGYEPLLDGTTPPLVGALVGVAAGLDKPFQGVGLLFRGPRVS